MLTAAAQPAPDLPADGGSDRQFATTLAHGMALLSCFRGGERALAHRDFVARTGLTKANVSRLAFTLVELGLLRREERGGRYLLGSPVLSMGYPLLARMHVRQIARPYMREMADELGAAVSLGVRDRARMIYVETSRSAAFAAEPADIGTVLPLLGSAMGHAWLASVSETERQRAVNQARVAAKEATGRQRAAAPAPDARALAARGYCSARDATAGTFTVAVPIRAPVDSEIVVFDCSLRAAGATPARFDAAGRRLVLMTRSVEAAMSLG